MPRMASRARPAVAGRTRRARARRTGGRRRCRARVVVLTIGAVDPRLPGIPVRAGPPRLADRARRCWRPRHRPAPRGSSAAIDQRRRSDSPVAAVGLLVPTWAGWINALRRRPGGRARRRARRRRRRVARRPAMVAEVVATGAIRGHLRARGRRRSSCSPSGYNPLTDPGCNVTCANVQPPAGGPPLEPRRLRARDGPHQRPRPPWRWSRSIREVGRGRSGVVMWAALLAVIVLSVPWVAHARLVDGLPDRGAGRAPRVDGGPPGRGRPDSSPDRDPPGPRGCRELVDQLADAGVAGRAGGSPQSRVQFRRSWTTAAGSSLRATRLDPATDPARAVVVSDAGWPRAAPRGRPSAKIPESRWRP